MTVIVKNNFVEKFVELGVRTVGTCIAADSRVEVLNSGEDASLESNSIIIKLVLVFFPDFLGHASS